jgi:hypothetical protein
MDASVTVLSPRAQYNVSMRTHHTLVRLAAAVAFGSLAIAGCGSGSHNPGTGSGGSTSSHGIADAAYQYSACMRAHGVPSFPDPHVSVSRGGNGTSTQVAVMVGGGGINPKAPAVRAAARKCNGILPGPGSQSAAQLAAQQHTREVDMLSFAQCMRGRGIASFPDPTAQGQLTLTMVTGAGVDLHAPQTLKSALACAPASHGALSPAQIERAVNGSG